jgi:hypothetical protein
MSRLRKRHPLRRLATDAGRVVVSGEIDIYSSQSKESLPLERKLLANRLPRSPRCRKIRETLAQQHREMHAGRAFPEQRPLTLLGEISLTVFGGQHHRQLHCRGRLKHCS